MLAGLIRVAIGRLPFGYGDKQGGCANHWPGASRALQENENHRLEGDCVCLHRGGPQCGEAQERSRNGAVLEKVFVPLNVTARWNNYDCVEVDPSNIFFICADRSRTHLAPHPTFNSTHRPGSTRLNCRS